MSWLEKTDRETFLDYLKDASNFSGMAERVFFPETEKDVAEILKKASEMRTPVTVAGGRTGLTGSAIPERGWILSTERLRAISEITAAGNEAVITAGPGVTLNELHAFTGARGWLYPPDSTEWNAFLGGTIATNASGARYFKYGATRPYVNALRLVLMNGETVTLRRGEHRARADRSFTLETEGQTVILGKLPSYTMPVVKHAAGYFVEPEMDIIDLIIGSEGTLGVVTEAELRLLPPPERVIAGVVFFTTGEMSWTFTKGITSSRESRYVKPHIRALEYFDEHSLAYLQPKYSNIPEEAKAAIWYELECSSREEHSLLTLWAEILTTHRALENSWYGTSEKDQRLFREFRHALPVLVNERIARNGFRKIATDFAVPLVALDDMMRTYIALASEAHIPFVVFGHIGNGHLHWNLIPENQAQFDRAWELYRRAAHIAIRLGGTISAEHGIGKIKIPYLTMLYGGEALKEMADVKKAFDPACLLGRANIIPESLLTPL